ncbi:MAG TPA: hypothetical protein VIK89_11360 [Cytophagaceae bacterium]
MKFIIQSDSIHSMFNRFYIHVNIMFYPKISVDNFRSFSLGYATFDNIIDQASHT